MDTHRSLSNDVPELLSARETLAAHGHQTRAPEVAEFAECVRQGLSSSLKKLHCKYLYDERGSKIFDAITELDEYYLTRKEREILSQSTQEMIAQMPENFELIEFGPGDGSKVLHFLAAVRELGKTCLYRPVDVSENAVATSTERVRRAYPDQDVHPILTDYLSSLDRLLRSTEPKLILFLGSSIGNYAPSEQEDLLIEIRRRMRGEDRLCLGFDLKKDIAVLHAAYNDQKNLTADFNLNLLLRINRDLGGTFDLSKFFHYEPYNPVTGAMESYLICREDLVVWIAALKQEFLFEKHEPIHIESSYKFSEPQIHRLAKTCGFEIEQNFTDDQNQFVDSFWRTSLYPFSN